MRSLNEERKRDDDLLLKIGIHEGPCLAVMLNERQDYFGQTVNIASRVQHLASSQAIYATGAVVGHEATAQLLAKAGVSPVPQRQTLRGIGDNFAVYEIP
jgi:class 3 adenylate cyclase